MLTRVSNGRDTVVAGISSHDREAVYASPIKRLEEHRPQLSLPARNLCDIT